MQVPLEIAFHNLDSSEAVEADIRERAAKLDALYSRLIACRVRVEAPHRQHRTGNLYEVHIEMSVPGDNLVISHAPHHADERYANASVYAVLRDAFDAAERKLKDFKEQFGEGHSGVAEPPLQGQIVEIRSEEGDGMILTGDGSQLLFTRDDVIDQKFDELNVGDVVRYVEAKGGRGTAHRVRPVPKE